MASLMPMPMQAFNAFVSGAYGPISGGLLYTYEAGTTTPKATYTTAVGDVANANPVVLNARGEPPAGIFLGGGGYKIVLKDSLGATIWTQDNVATQDSLLQGDLASTTDPAKGAALVGFKRHGAAGAVARTVYSKLGEFISVKDFGAVGDGVTDDTAAIKAALNSGALAVLAPVGTYLVNSTITLPAGMTLSGQGPGTVFLINAATTGFSKVFDSVSDASITVSNCKIQANVDGVTGIAFTLCRYTTIQNVFFVGCTTSFAIDRGDWHNVKGCFNLGLASPSLKAGSATIWSSVDNDYVFHVDVDGYQSRNIGNGTKASTLYVRRCVAGQFRAIDCNDLNVGNSSPQQFIVVENDCQGVKFTDCICAAAYAGYVLQRGSGAAVDPSFVVFTSCDADQCSTAGYLVTGANWVSIQGACVTASGVATTKQGMLLQPSGSSQVNQIDISNSIIHGYNGTNGTGFQIAGATYVTIRNNKIDSNNICVGISGTSTYIDISGNSMSNYSTALSGTPSQTGNRAVDNPGYNPVGDGAISVGASPFTYTADISPETVYIWGGTISSVTFGKNGSTLTTVASSSTPIAISLGPREQLKVTYTAAPNMNKMVH